MSSWTLQFLAPAFRRRAQRCCESTSSMRPMTTYRSSQTRTPSASRPFSKMAKLPSGKSLFRLRLRVTVFVPASATCARVGCKFVSLSANGPLTILVSNESLRSVEGTYIQIYVQTYKHTYTRPYIHTHIHTCAYAHIYTHVRTYAHIYVHTYIHTYIQSSLPHPRSRTRGSMNLRQPLDMDTYIHTYAQTYIHTYVCTDAHTYIHTYVHTYIHTYIHTYVCTFVKTYLQTYIHTHIHTYIHTNIHAVHITLSKVKNSWKRAPQIAFSSCNRAV